MSSGKCEIDKQDSSSYADSNGELPASYMRLGKFMLRIPKDTEQTPVVQQEVAPIADSILEELAYALGYLPRNSKP